MDLKHFCAVVFGFHLFALFYLLPYTFNIQMYLNVFLWNYSTSVLKIKIIAITHQCRFVCDCLRLYLKYFTFFLKKIVFNLDLNLFYLKQIIHSVYIYGFMLLYLVFSSLIKLGFTQSRSIHQLTQTIFTIALFASFFRRPLRNFYSPS